uniref:Uncharacterized protein n=1 Tax=Anabas testudineus TaxID=64144 RepID=A0A3Q1J1L8_ANATE
MEDRSENPISVKVEEHSQYVVLTYFQGDISSMVDAHFTRALNKDYKTKAPAAKTKKIRKSIKLGKHTKSTSCPPAPSQNCFPRGPQHLESPQTL